MRARPGATATAVLMAVVLAAVGLAATAALGQGSAQASDPHGDVAHRDPGQADQWPWVDILEVGATWDGESATLAYRAAADPTAAEWALWTIETNTGTPSLRDRFDDGPLAIGGCEPGTVQAATDRDTNTRHLLLLDPDCVFRGSPWATVRLLVTDTDHAGQSRVTDEAATLHLGPVPDPIPTHIPVERKGGATRLQTAVGIARDFSSPDTVVLARADTYADALAAAPLAAALQAPVLLTGPDPDYEVAQILRSQALRLLVVVGGPAAVSDDTVEAYRDGAEFTVERIGGRTRWDTAALIADRLADQLGGHALTGAVVVEGANDDPGRGWPDAVAASVFAARRGWALVPTLADELPERSARALGLLAEDAEVVVVGGPAAVSDAVVDAVATASPDAAPQRIAGEDRYGTSRAVAAHDLDATALWIATGASFPDALTAAAGAMRRDAALVLTPTDRFVVAARWIEDRGGCQGLTSITLVGGVAALSQQVEDDARRRAGQPDCG